jgi:sugar transferase (PEP-CTERM/EpsH1 system associated)
VRVLVLTHRLPWAPNRGDRIRAYHLLKALSRRYEVHLLSLVHDDEEAAEAPALESWLESVTTVRVGRARGLARAAAALFGSTPLTFAMLDAPGLAATADRVAARVSPDVVIAYCSGMARLLSHTRLAFVPAIVDLVDVDSEKWAALSKTALWPMRWIYRREARLLARAEARMMRAAAATTVVNDREARSARHIAPGARIEVAGNGIDRSHFAPETAGISAPQVVFCGVMDYAPNAETAIFLATEVWPRVRSERPDARLVLVGSSPPPALMRAAARADGVTVTGRVADVRPWLWSSALATAPIRTARGVQNKVLEAVAAGLPAVVSPVVAEGLPDGVRPACLVATSSEDCARRILEVLGLPDPDRRRLAARASFAGLDWADRLAPLMDLVAELASGPEHAKRRCHRAEGANHWRTA